MTIKLNTKLGKFVSQRVESGEYMTAEEVVRDALRLLELRQLQIDNLRRELAEGLKAAEEGRYTTYTSATSHRLVDKIKREGRKRLAAAKRAG